MSSSGFSATSGSRLFISIRRAASCTHPLQLIWAPRGARIVRVVAMTLSLISWARRPGPFWILDEGAHDPFRRAQDLTRPDQAGDRLDVRREDAVPRQVRD